MKIKLFALGIITLCISHQSFAQQADTTWKHSLIAGLNLSQVSYSNWAQGGEDALAYSILIAGKSINDLPNTNWTTQYNFAYGQTKLGDKSSRKTDDKIEISSVFTYKLGVYVNPYASVTFLSQFTTGYKYTDTSRTGISDFLDPAYSTQTIGLGYEPMKQFKTRLGIGIRETFTKLYTQYSDDPSTTEVETTHIEGGFESITDFSAQLDENILYTTKLQLFAPLKTMGRIVVHFDNILTAKISKYLSTNLTVNVINDQVVTPRTQIKEGLSLGITYSIF
ncbi:MAG: DUF3078 domain-containing protein [bacterium]